jgi:pimeloyl-ACP methyl ester carboxylesterase
MTHSGSALAHVLDRPDGDPWGGLVILHGAGSRKENHADMARAAAAAGLATVRFDMRGHGETGGLLDGRAIEDVVAAAGLLPPGLPVALRGSSMGGYLALVSARAVGAAAVVAICPAPAPLLARGLRDGRLEVAADGRHSRRCSPRTRWTRRSLSWTYRS